MRPALLLSLGTVAGLLVGAGVALFFFQAGETPPDTGPDWKERAGANTMPGRRAYTLPLNNPDMVPVNQASHMKDEDIILGVLIGGEARAYPWWLTSNYHVVNDTVDDVPLLITLCEVCGGASAFRPVVPDLPGLSLSFQICGVSRGTIQILDHQTLSKWSPFLGTAMEGPLTGRSLENFPLLVMTWKEWKQHYPQGFVANGSPQLRSRPHGAEAGNHIGDSELPPLFAATANLTDARLGRHELVLGVKDSVSQKAYAAPIALLQPFPNVFRLRLDSKPFLVIRSGDLALTAFDLSSTPYAEGAFSLVSTNPVTVRSPDGLEWNNFGIRIPAEGKEIRLPAAKSYLTEWYEWVSHSPESEIVQQTNVVSGEVGSAFEEGGPQPLSR